MEVNEEFELEVDSDVDDESDEEEVELFVDEEAEANHEAESMQWKAIRFRPKVITDNEKTLWNKVKGRVHAVVRKIAQSIWRSNAKGKGCKYFQWHKAKPHNLKRYLCCCCSLDGMYRLAVQGVKEGNDLGTHFFINLSS